MKTANNPFLATVQNKTSTTSNIDNRHNNTPSINSNINSNTNDKGNKKLRRQTISDPHAYIRYIHSLLGDKCISKPCTSTLAKSTTTTTTSTATTANNDKSQKQCQQQQQLQQIGLQFQGIALYDDDVAKSQNNNTNSSSCSFINNEPGNNKWKIDNRSNDYDKRKALENQLQQQQQQYQQTELSLKEKQQQQQQQQYLIGIEGKLTEQIRIYNNNMNMKMNMSGNKSRKSYNNHSGCSRELWMGTYPTTRVKKIPISNTSTVTYTTTTNATRMTPKIAPTTRLTKILMDMDENEEDCEGRPIKSALRKHHSFNMQPTYIMHKQMYLQQKLEQPQSVASIAKQKMIPTTLTTTTTTIDGKTQERDVNEIEQQLMTSRYQATFGGPLVFRPLTLNEKHNFKPIARPDGMSVVCDDIKLQEAQEDTSQYSSILSEQVDEFKKQTEDFSVLKEIQELNTTLSSSSSTSSSSSSSPSSSTTITPTLHPAASLEVLEALTQSNPELIYAAIQPGSRLNLHTQLSALNETHYGMHMSAGQTQLRAKLHATLSESDNIEDNAQKHRAALRRNNVYIGNTDIDVSADEKQQHQNDADADFCFYEISSNETETYTQTPESSPNAAIVLNTSSHEGQVKYLVKQNLHQMHI